MGISAIVIAIVLSISGFFLGVKYQQGKTSQTTVNESINKNGNLRGRGTNGPSINGLRTKGLDIRPVAGEIISRDEKSITVKLADGSSKLILISNATTISKATDGTVEDLKVGETIRVFGSSNNDGIVTAQNVQLGALGNPEKHDDNTP